MFVKNIATGVFVAALMSGTALAQAPAPSQSSTPARAETSATPVENQSSSQWRSSKLIGLYVYNDSDERLGSINDLLTDASGKIQKVVIGVGGFLGIGESDVAVNYDQLKFVNEPMKTVIDVKHGSGWNGHLDRNGHCSNRHKHSGIGNDNYHNDNQCAEDQSRSRQAERDQGPAQGYGPVQIRELS